jgi:hypothetical protein
MPDLVCPYGPVSVAARDFANIRPLTQKLACAFDRQIKGAENATAGHASIFVKNAPCHDLQLVIFLKSYNTRKIPIR